MANQAYNCKDRCPDQTFKCQNEGFIDSSCNCRCPEHITGQFCETILKKNSNFLNNLKLINIKFCYNKVMLKSLPLPRLTCNFEIDLCDWSQEEARDSEEWIRNKGLTKTQIIFRRENNRFRTGPQLLEDSRKS